MAMQLTHVRTVGSTSMTDAKHFSAFVRTAIVASHSISSICQSQTYNRLAQLDPQQRCGTVTDALDQWCPHHNFYHSTHLGTSTNLHMQQIKLRFGFNYLPKVNIKIK